MIVVRLSMVIMEVVWCVALLKAAAAEYSF